MTLPDFGSFYIRCARSIHLHSTNGCPRAWTYSSKTTWSPDHQINMGTPRRNRVIRHDEKFANDLTVDFLSELIRQWVANVLNVGVHCFGPSLSPLPVSANGNTASVTTIIISYSGSFACFYRLSHDSNTQNKVRYIRRLLTMLIYQYHRCIDWVSPAFHLHPDSLFVDDSKNSTTLIIQTIIMLVDELDRDLGRVEHSRTTGN